MWLFCCGMKRSGSTLQYQIASRLVCEYLAGKRVEWKPEQELDFEEQEANHHPWLVYKCHRCTPEIAQRLRDTENKGVYTYRDIRDVCGSWIRKHDSNFFRLIKTGFIQECLENFQQFTSFSNVLVQRYEDLVQNLEKEVERLATHLSIDLPSSRIALLAVEYGIDAQRQRIAQMGSGSDDTFQYGDQLIDRQELLHSNHITDGRVAGWADFFSMQELAIIEEQAGDWMEEVGYVRVADRLGMLDRWRLKKFRRTLPASR